MKKRGRFNHCFNQGEFYDENKNGAREQVNKFALINPNECAFVLSSTGFFFSSSSSSSSSLRKRTQTGNLEGCLSATSNTHTHTQWNLHYISKKPRDTQMKLPPMSLSSSLFFFLLVLSGSFTRSSSSFLFPSAQLSLTLRFFLSFFFFFFFFFVP